MTNEELKKELIIYEDDDGEDEHGRSIIRKWGICPYCGEKVGLPADICPHCGKGFCNEK